jgi:hypothetical protein
MSVWNEKNWPNYFFIPKRVVFLPPILDSTHSPSGVESSEESSWTYKKRGKLNFLSGSFAEKKISHIFATPKKS